MAPPDRDQMERRLFRLAEAMQGRFANTPDSALSRPERAFRSVWELEAEVNNGGFHQYFSNSSGRRAAEAPAALRAVGALHTAAIVEAALGAVGKGVAWGDDTRRQAAVEALSEAADASLDALDARFYAYPDDLTARLYSFVAEHRAEFAAPVGF